MKNDCSQYDLFENIRKNHSSFYDKEKRNWENGFQRWCNEQAEDELTSTGICGWGSMCDYCTDNTYGRPCVRALNAACKEKHIRINYSNRNYDEIWRDLNNATY